jgi:hypothetical protein
VEQAFMLHRMARMKREALALLGGRGGASDHVALLHARGYRVAVDNVGAGRAGFASFALLEPKVLNDAKTNNAGTRIRRFMVLPTFVTNEASSLGV